MKIDLKRAFCLLLLLGVAAFAFAGGDQEAAPVEGVSVEEVVDAYFANMPDTMYMVGQTDFVEMVAAGEEMTVLDIRSAEDYAAGHIAGAVNLAWGTTDLTDQVASIPQEDNVFVYCYSGQTSGQAVALMNLVGIPARSVKFGWIFGISKVEGFEAVTETTGNTLPAVANYIDSNLLAAYTAYYEEIDGAVGTAFTSNIVSEANAKAIHDAADPDVVFVSVRKPDAFAEAHIDGAINMPWGTGMQKMFPSLPVDKKIIIYCYSGQTAGQAVAMLRILGYDAVSLKGGMGVGANAPMGWANRGFPTVASN